jgi:hypothetical protein
VYGLLRHLIARAKIRTEAELEAVDNGTPAIWIGDLRESLGDVSRYAAANRPIQNGDQTEIHLQKYLQSRPS